MSKTTIPTKTVYEWIGDLPDDYCNYVAKICPVEIYQYVVSSGVEKAMAVIATSVPDKEDQQFLFELHDYYRYGNQEMPEIPTQKESKMKELKHTLGPWKKSSHRDISPDSYVYRIGGINKRGRYDIASVLGGFDDEEADANLQLILAAPEMIEVLIEIRSNLHIFNDSRKAEIFGKKIDSVIEYATRNIS